MSKVVLITGGSSGIGKAIGTHLVSRGYIVYGTSRNPEQFSGHSLPFPLLKLDVTDPENAIAVAHEIQEKEGRIDVLINNAGVGITGPLEETPTAEIRRAFDTNFYGPIHMMKAVLPYMRAHRKGLIINITSIAGYMGLPYRGVYSATKGALSLVSESMQMELYHMGIDICNIAPGDFNTNIAHGRYHSPVLDTSDYKKHYGRVMKVINEQMADSADPSLIGKKVERIIEKKNRKLHYKAGAFMEKMSVKLKQVLPDKVFNKLLLNHYKL
ncbi:SDR family oxidoreductase [Robertkochia flava]|uniref:SDR family oxidoreductase n=1 Tax=Robertkochia flava TaxID=3447986 RepID=UPI001CCEBCE2|nr:SDR family oxidoreductase [Robertkochia marina]